MEIKLDFLIISLIILVIILILRRINYMEDRGDFNFMLSNRKCSCGNEKFIDNTYVCRFSAGHQIVEIKLTCECCSMNYVDSYDLIDKKNHLTYEEVLEKLNMKPNKNLNWNA